VEPFLQAGPSRFEQAEADFRFSIAKLDKAGYRRVLHPNTAKRRKSALAHAYAAAKAKAKPSAA